MNTREAAKQYRYSQWTERIREQRASGLNIREWCEQTGIRRQQYHYWQRKLREAACQELAILEATQEQNLAPSGWTRLAPPPAPDEQTNTLTVEIGDYRVIVTAETNPELLAQTCCLLKSL